MKGLFVQYFTINRLSLTILKTMILLAAVVVSETIDHTDDAGIGVKRFHIRDLPDHTDRTQLNHLSRDDETGFIYIGAVNRIIRLDENLAQIGDVVTTGPRLDDARCTELFGQLTCSGGGQQHFVGTTIDNINKVLVVDHAHGRLVTCGSIFQGICQTRSLFNLSAVIEPEPRSNTDYFVASNHPTRSTVSFIGPGPDGQNVLYVASTYSGTAPLRHAVPTISSRQLAGPNVFKFTYVDGLTGGSTLIRLRREAIEKFLVDYVTGFTVDGFAYFLANQPDSFRMENSGITQPVVSETRSARLVRICTTDRKYYSYIEIPIQCRTNSTNFSLIRAATVVKASRESGAQGRGGEGVMEEGGETDGEGDDVVLALFSTGGDGMEEVEKSAACKFRLADIVRTVEKNIQRCFTSSQKFVGQQFSNRMCATLSLPGGSGGSYCGESESNSPLVGEVALVSSPLITYSDDTRLTAVAATRVHGRLIAFLGTTDGRILKMSEVTEGVWQEYDAVSLEDNSPINKDLILDTNNTFLYAMSLHQVVKLPLADCSSHGSTCRSCRSAKNPFCGWCSIEKRCSTKFDCRDFDKEKRWLASGDTECIFIPRKFVNPTAIPVGIGTEVAIGVRALPALIPQERYMCTLASTPDYNRSTIGSVSANEIRCTILSASVAFLAFPRRQDHVNVTLSIWSTRTNVLFVSTTLSFINCSQHVSCTSCTTSQWGCRWCVYSNICLIPDNARMQSCVGTITQNHEVCPRLVHGEGSETLIPVGIPGEIQLSAVFLPTEPLAIYECLIHVTSPPVRLTARRESISTIVCDAYTYNYDTDEALKKVSVEVVWNSSYLLDDNYGVTVTMFKCERLALDCTSCSSLQDNHQTDKYGCVWCDNQCRHSSHCNRSSHSLGGDKCPLPNVDQVNPVVGPIEGGTRLTITGSNLGRSFSNIRNAITVVGVPCEPLPDEYIISKRIVCKTGKINERKRGNIAITIDDATVVWETEFKYQDPRLLSMTPTQGPRSGGTVVTFEGFDLDTGNDRQIFFEDIPCLVKDNDVNSTRLVCTTLPVSDAFELPVSVRFDDAIRRYNGYYRYTVDPTVTHLEPLISFQSGGRVITVIGTRLDSIQRPLMLFSSISSIYNSTCTVISSVEIHCRTPRVAQPTAPDRRLKRSPGPVATFIISFVMDDVESVRNLSPVFSQEIDHTLIVVADPIFNLFENGKKSYRGEALVLTGHGLNAACRPSEITILIGREMCKIHSLEASTLYCIPPKRQPLGLDKTGHLDSAHQPVVTVTVGNMVQELGRLEYERFAMSNSDYWVIGMAVCGGAIFTIITIILVMYRRRSTEAVGQFKKLQAQLDALESNIRNECKQAFAELQTEVSDFTSDINAIGIPFWDYRTYVLNILFPAPSDQSLLDDYCKTKRRHLSSYQEDCLTSFRLLLNNRHFLTIFIDTMERQKTFSIKDRSLVASLLTVILSDRMDYLTEILEALLTELIAKSVERRQPKLILRRTESVVEKLLTNWIALCMYNHLRRHHVGKAVFMLYKAVKHQTEKGPVDAVTSDARYSLDEQRLLRLKTEAKVLTIYLQSTNQEPIICRMLDCDIISQAKEKALDAIFMNTPLSSRPSVHDVTLEWHSSSHCHVILQDEDFTSVVVKGWLALNTLAHYDVPDGATMSLVTRRRTDLSPVGTLEMGSPSPISSTTPFFLKDETSKVFHLVKQEENQNVPRSQKVISEIFLTRLLATKCTLQQYISDLFFTIFTADIDLPPVIKYLFDFLDTAFERHNIADPEVLTIWKNNSLPLRFWVNIINNPQIIFDVSKPLIVDSCLTVITQAFMDSCSTQLQTLGKDSPSSKLLFAKDIPHYRHWLTQFYRDIQLMPPVSDNEIMNVMKEISMINVEANFNVCSALKELNIFAMRYGAEILNALNEDHHACQLRLNQQFQHFCETTDVSKLY